LHKLGLRLKPGLEFDEWLRLGGQIAGFDRAASWALGDWFFYGEWEYGSKYELGVKITGLSKQSLSDLKYVAGRFEEGRRRDNVSLSHHREVAPKPPEEQDRWLNLAIENDWTRDELRRAISADRQVTPPADPPALRGPLPSAGGAPREVLPARGELLAEYDFKTDLGGGHLASSNVVAWIEERLDQTQEWDPDAATIEVTVRILAA